jgi:hypothetical protein
METSSRTARDKVYLCLDINMNAEDSPIEH